MPAPKVVYTIHCLHEDLPVRGNTLASGDEDADRETEEWVQAQIALGNQWAWCTIRVIASCEGFYGEAQLGCCTYNNEKEFLEDPYSNDLKHEAYNNLIRELRDVAVRGEYAQQLLIGLPDDPPG